MEKARQWKILYEINFNDKKKRKTVSKTSKILKMTPQASSSSMKIQQPDDPLLYVI